MLPLPQDVLANLRSTLDRVLIPELQGGYAREQAALMSSLLEHLRLRTELEHEHLVADTLQMRSALQDLPLTEEQSDRLSAVPEIATGATSLPDLRHENLSLRAIVADVVDGPIDQEDRRTVQTLLRNQLDRDRAMIGPGYRTGS